jgi:dienelactone hydrolase
MHLPPFLRAGLVVCLCAWPGVVTVGGEDARSGLAAWQAAWPVQAPLDIEWLGETEHDGVKVRALRYTGSIAGGEPQRIYALYALPPSAGPGQKVPAIVQIHGGGQTCQASNVAWFARRGYACLAFDWGGPRDGRGPETTTVWGSAVSRDYIDRPAGGVGDVFLLHAVLAGRRAIDVLQEQPEVDAGRVAVQGISWGGLLTWLVGATEPRVKAVVPVYGVGGLDRGKTGEGEALRRRGEEWARMWTETFDPRRLSAEVKAPVLFCNGANDWFGTLSSSEEAMSGVRVDHARSYAPNRNHSLDRGNVQAAMDWLDGLLKSDAPPAGADPGIDLAASGEGGLMAVVKADGAADVQVLFSRGRRPDVARCWLQVAALRGENGNWTATLPVWRSDEPVSAMAQAFTKDGAAFTSKVFLDVLPNSIAGVREVLATDAGAVIAPAGDLTAWFGETTTDFPGCFADEGLRRVDIEGRSAVTDAVPSRLNIATRRPADPGVLAGVGHDLVIWTHDLATAEVRLNENSRRLPGVKAWRAQIQPGPGWVQTVLKPADFAPLDETASADPVTRPAETLDLSLHGKPVPGGTAGVGEVAWAPPGLHSP